MPNLIVFYLFKKSKETQSQHQSFYSQKCLIPKISQEFCLTLVRTPDSLLPVKIAVQYL